MGNSSWLDLGVRGRIVFACTYLIVQAGLVLSANERPDGLFSFHMFNESSTLSISLFRRVHTADGSMVVVPTQGTWEAKDERGVVHAFNWNDRVRDGALATLGRTLHASYGVEAQLFHLQMALDDVVAHTPEDHDTLALVARVDVVKNGRAHEERVLESRR